MAQKTVTSLIDDLDGRKADESLTFGLDGATYAIDLSAKNAAKLRKALTPFVASARRTPRRTGGRGGKDVATSRRSSNTDRTTAIREWARTHGHTVSDRGRIAGSVVDAYDKAH
jgi:hypothetical protein